MTVMLPAITSHQNPWVKNALRLHRSSERKSQQRFLIEGNHLLQEAVATGWPLDAVCFDQQWLSQNHPLLERVIENQNVDRHVEFKPTSLQPVTKDILRRLSTTDTPCSVVAIAHQCSKRELIPYPFNLQVAVESLQDPGNLGSLIRIAAAAGIGPTILTRDSVDPTNPKVLRSTAGQWFRSPPLIRDLPEFIEEQKSRKVQVLAASSEGKCFWEYDLTVPTLFVLGNEGAGLSPQIRKAVTGTISIPMTSGVESLNVSVSGSLLIYEALRQTSSAPKNG